MRIVPWLLFVDAVVVVVENGTYAMEHCFVKQGAGPHKKKAFESIVPYSIVKIHGQKK